MSIVNRLTIKISVFPELVCRFKSILTKIAANYFMGTGMLKHIWKGKRPRIIRAVLRNINHTGPILANANPSLKP